VEDPAFELGHLTCRHALLVGKVVERAQQVAEGVAELAIGVGRAGEHFLADADVLEIVGRGDPEAEDVGAIVANDQQRIDDVADRFRHLAPVLVEREAVGENFVVGRAAACAGAFEQGRLEPAAMLVGAFDIDVGAGAFAVARLNDVGVGRAGIEPDVEDVGDDLIVVEAVALAEQGLVIGVEPSVRAALRKASTIRALTSGSRRYSPVLRFT
jgi:hypothetical protein